MHFVRLGCGVVQDRHDLQFPGLRCTSGIANTLHENKVDAVELGFHPSYHFTDHVMGFEWKCFLAGLSRV